MSNSAILPVAAPAGILLPPLIRGTLIRRYKRFLADVRLDDGSETTVHVANPGGMTGLAEPGMTVYLSDSRDPKRKLRHSWELVETAGGLVGVNTARPNRLAEAAISAGAIPELRGYTNLRREVRYGQNSRVDLLLSDQERPNCYVEIKNVHLRRAPGLAEFPDAVTARGRKHLADLSAVVAAGHRAALLFVVQRGDCDRFDIAADIDPAYAAAMKSAIAKGVEVLCYACRVDLDKIEIGRPLALEFSAQDVR